MSKDFTRLLEPEQLQKFANNTLPVPNSNNILYKLVFIFVLLKTLPIPHGTEQDTGQNFGGHLDNSNLKYTSDFQVCRGIQFVRKSILLQVINL
jgi:hypothetical protein